MLKRCLLAFSMSLLVISVPEIMHAQDDTLQTSVSESIQVKPVSKRYSPRKATLLSAAFPGLGQAYTKQYWKMPIIYAGAGVLGYFIVNYHQQYVSWQDKYGAQRLASEANLPLPVLRPGTDEPYSLDMLALRYRFYERNRTFTIILSGVLYALNIMDANVTAHLKDFDLSDDLSLTVKPSFYQPGAPFTNTGLTLTLNLK